MLGMYTAVVAWFRTQHDCLFENCDQTLGTRLQGSREDYITKSFMLYSSPDIIRVIESRRLRWARYVARMADDRCIEGFSGETRGKEAT
jgi:hypothetical protein